jgi:threonine synthase
VRARDESGGAIEAVTDEEILAAYRDVARHEGVFCEPASAASLAGLRKRARSGATSGVHRVVCVLTGNGLKDPDTARSLASELMEVEATTDAVRRVLSST